MEMVVVAAQAQRPQPKQHQVANKASVFLLAVNTPTQHRGTVSLADWQP